MTLSLPLLLAVASVSAVDFDGPGGLSSVRLSFSAVKAAAQAAGAASKAAPLYGAPIRDLESGARVWDEIVVAEVRSTRIVNGPGQHDDSVESELVVLESLKGSIAAGAVVRADSFVESYPYDARELLARARPGQVFLLPLFTAFAPAGAWHREWHFSTELSGPWAQHPYYLDFRTALARVSGSNKVFRQKAPFISRAQAEQIAKTHAENSSRRVYGPQTMTTWRVIRANLDDDVWDFQVEYWFDDGNGGKHGFGSTLIEIDAENGRVVGQIAS